MISAEEILRAAQKTNGATLKLAEKINKQIGAELPDSQKINRLYLLIVPGRGPYYQISKKEKTWMQAISMLEPGEKRALGTILNALAKCRGFSTVGKIRNTNVYELLNAKYKNWRGNYRGIGKNSAAFIKLVFKKNE